MNATPRSSLFSAAHQLRAAGSDAYNASGRNGFGLDDNVYQSLLQNRIIFLGSEVKDENANAICAQMLLLNAEDPHKDIYLYINSPGGSVDSGMAIYDTMKWISNDVATVAIGLAASMGQFLLCAGEKGKRYALPHSRIMMHQPSGGLGGTASDIRMTAAAADNRTSGRHSVARGGSDCAAIRSSSVSSNAASKSPAVV